MAKMFFKVPGPNPGPYGLTFAFEVAQDTDAEDVLKAQGWAASMEDAVESYKMLAGDTSPDTTGLSPEERAKIAQDNQDQAADKAVLAKRQLDSDVLTSADVDKALETAASIRGIAAAALKKAQDDFNAALAGEMAATEAKKAQDKVLNTSQLRHQAAQRNLDDAINKVMITSNAMTKARDDALAQASARDKALAGAAGKKKKVL